MAIRYIYIFLPRQIGQVSLGVANRIWLALAIFLCLATFETAAAQSSISNESEIPVLALVPGQDAISVASYLRYSAVSDVSLNPNEIIEIAPRLKSLETDSIQFGTPNGPLLVRMNIQNTGSIDASWILFSGRGSLSEIQIWRLDGEPRLLLNGFNKAELISNLRTYQAFSAEISLAPGEQADLAIMFEATDSTYLPLKIQTFRSFFSDRRTNIAAVAGVVCGVLVLILLNIVFFAITGKREFIWLGMAELAFVLNTLHAEGYTTIFVFSAHPLLGIVFGDSVKCAFAIFMSQFARIFVSTRVRFPRVDIVLRLYIYTGVAIILAHMGSAFWPEGLRTFLFYASWLIAITSSLILPYVGIIATRHLGREYWPLILAWGSLALYILYTAVASSGIISGLPTLWHLAGPVGLFEALMATFALALHIKAIQSEKMELDANLNKSLRDRLKISERAVSLERDRASALASLSDQNSLLHASGHDMRQVVSVIQSAAGAIKRGRDGENLNDLPDLLIASAGYLEDIAATSMSAAVPGTSTADAIALSGLELGDLLKPIERIYRQVCQDAKLSFSVKTPPDIFIVTDRALILRTLSNLLSNAVKFSEPGGSVEVLVRREGDRLHIEISDRGVGISDSLAAKLNSDQALGAREIENIAGTGWGFAQSRLMTSRLGGSLRIASRDDGGSCVSLELPLASGSLKYCTFEKFQSELEQSVSDLVLRDGDMKGSSNARDGLSLYAIYDDTAKGRARIASKNPWATILIRPLCREMMSHPSLITPRQNLDQA